MKTEEEKKAYQKAYYERTKKERCEKAKEKYRIKHNVVEKYENKKVSDVYNKKYKGFKFSYSKGILSFEIKLPFRVQVEKYDAKHTDEETYTLLYRELKHKLRSIDPTQTIFIFEPEYIQFFSANIEAMDKVVEAVKEFIKEKTEIYGKYRFKGRYIGAQF